MNSPPSDGLPIWVVLLIPVAFVVFFVVIWSGVCLLLSVIGGWGRIAQRFPARQPPTGTGYGGQTGMVGTANYRGVLTVHASTEGIHVAVMVFFRLGHPPLFIPWSEMHDVSTRRILLFEYVGFDVGSPKIARLHLAKQIFAGRLPAD